MANKRKPKVLIVTIKVPFGDKAFGYEQSQAEGGQVPIGGRSPPGADQSTLANWLSIRAFDQPSP